MIIIFDLLKNAVALYKEGNAAVVLEKLFTKEDDQDKMNSILVEEDLAEGWINPVCILQIKLLE